MSVDLNGSPLNVLNVYVPPVSRDRGYRPDIAPILNFSESDTVICGDFNAHHAAWFSATNGDDTAARGDDFLEEIETSNFAILNEDTPTRQPANGPKTSPDISLISAHLSLEVIWDAVTELNSDHLPIIIGFEDPREEEQADSKTYVNLKAANWPEWQRYIEVGVSRLKSTQSCSRGVTSFNEVIVRANKKFIPAGRFPSYKPAFPREARDLQKRRDALRAENSEDPQISQLNQEINNVLKESKKAKWEDKLREADLRNAGSTKAHWRLLKGLRRGPRPEKNQPIKFGGKVKTCLKFSVGG